MSAPLLAAGAAGEAGVAGEAGGASAAARTTLQLPPPLCRWQARSGPAQGPLGSARRKRGAAGLREEGGQCRGGVKARARAEARARAKG